MANISATQASVIAAAASFLSAVLVAAISGHFNSNSKAIERLKEEAVEKIRQEGSARSEEVRQITAKVVEETKADSAIKLEKFKLQRDLILDALETDDKYEAQKRLRFFALTGLIPDYESKVLQFTDNQSVDDIPLAGDSIEPILAPLLDAQNQHEFKRVAQLQLRSGGRNTFVCSAVAIQSNVFLVPQHCINGKNIKDYALYLSTSPSDPIEIESVVGVPDSSEKRKKISSDIALLKVPKSKVYFQTPIKARAAVKGEAVYIVGFTLRSRVGLRSISIEPLDTNGAAFTSGDCVVKEINVEEAFVSTTCITSSGTSGSPIFAKSDGALVSVVTFGRNLKETNGPILENISSLLRSAGQ